MALGPFTRRFPDISEKRSCKTMGLSTQTAISVFSRQNSRHARTKVPRFAESALAREGEFCTFRASRPSQNSTAGSDLNALETIGPCECFIRRIEIAVLIGGSGEGASRSLENEKTQSEI